MVSTTEIVLILGASGMLGNAALRVLAEETDHQVYGACRGSGALDHLLPPLREKVVTGVDVENFDSLMKVVAKVQPTVIINCVGVVKQLADASDPLVALPLNAMLPHRLARLCSATGARLIHVSTDCVFNGKRGNYSEDDAPDATDLYGQSKYMGETEYPNAVTLRTSIIGHEFGSRNGIIDWFLAQAGPIKGYNRAVFSGLTTVELSRVMARYIITNPDITGLYHVSVEPISKYDMLSIVAEVYGKSIDIVPSDTPVIDRSLNSDRFRAETGYAPPEWNLMIKELKDFYVVSENP